jgi:putative tricarboxylic transport membrane protein
MGIFGYFAVRPLAKTLHIPKVYLMPCVALICVAGSYVARNNIIDIYVMLGAGVLGFVFNRTGVPVAPLLITFIITPPFEQALRQALTRSEGSFMPFLTNPVALTLLAAAIVLFVLSLRRELRERRASRPIHKRGTR